MLKTLRNGRVVNVERGQNGMNYVTLDSVNPVCHVVAGNTKVGEGVGSWNSSVELSCDHRCECYRKKKCYACGGNYNYIANQTSYTENYLFYKISTVGTIVRAIADEIKANKYSLFRYFTCGDIPGAKFMAVMVELAKLFPNIHFWTYTKKYGIVNRYVDEHGIESIPDNLVIIFSHWMNDDGTYFPMSNPHNFPTSEYIPYGKEELVETVTHVCPCSNPDVVATCATCDHPCYKLKHGESMALLEHSTSATRERDKQLKAAHSKL